jgi:hypothetical protein
LAGAFFAADFLIGALFAAAFLSSAFFAAAMDQSARDEPAVLSQRADPS